MTIARSKAPKKRVVDKVTCAAAPDGSLVVVVVVVVVVVGATLEEAGTIAFDELGFGFIDTEDVLCTR